MWETLDVAKLLARREEATTSGNAGAFAVPLGPVLSRYPSPLEAQPYDPYKDRGSASVFQSEAGNPYGGYQSIDDWMLPRRG